MSSSDSANPSSAKIDFSSSVGFGTGLSLAPKALYQNVLFLLTF